MRLTATRRRSRSDGRARALHLAYQIRAIMADLRNRHVKSTT